MSQNQLYESLVEVIEDYLGPAASRFVDRQITFHLGIKPENITTKDLSKLVEWIKVSLALLTDDKKFVDDATARIMALKESA